MSITFSLFTLATNLISTGGYPALLLLTFLDSTVIPVPNEAIMPFAGYLVSTGRFSFVAVIAISVPGAVLGALTSYAIGSLGAEPFVKRFGRYVRLSTADLQKTHGVFERYGEKIILVSRFIPVVRQFISIPAGAAKMNVVKFMLYTAIGSLFWNSLIVAFGYWLGEHWTSVGAYTAWADKIIIALLAALCGWFLYSRWQKRKPI